MFPVTRAPVINAAVPERFYDRTRKEPDHLGATLPKRKKNDKSVSHSQSMATETRQQRLFRIDVMTLACVNTKYSNVYSR